MKCQAVFMVSLACILVATQALPDESKKCEPGSIVKVDCNECVCNQDGTDMACTKKMCTGSEDGAAPVADAMPQADQQSDNCVPGETFKKDCNDCTCPPSGIKSAAACTLLACLDDELQKD